VEVARLLAEGNADARAMGAQLENLRRIIASATMLVVGQQIMASSWFLSVLGLKTTSRKPPEAPAEG